MQQEDIYAEINSIRNLMERSSKFISLSGLSGILAGIYALIGAAVGYTMIYREHCGLRLRDHYVNDPLVYWPLFLVALVVLVLSLVTGVWLSARNAHKKGQSFWNPGSKRLIASVSVPLVSGGLFILILIFRGEYGIIAPASLLFYGLALVAGSNYTFSDVKWLGLLEIALGLIASLFPGYGLIFWSIGFGVLHILYGSIMHFKYDR
jgi:general stress protein CsbA